MVGSTKIGVIAEEKNDVDVLYQVTAKLVSENSFTLAQFVGHGGGKLQKKARCWADNLIKRGCEAIVLIHDLDKQDEPALRATLSRLLDGINEPPIIILIPVQEIESWLLCDPRAIKAVFNMRRAPRLPGRPEELDDPKRWLSRLVKTNSKTTYLNTIHNKRIAEEMSLSGVTRKCPSFSAYPPFVKDLFRP